MPKRKDELTELPNGYSVSTYWDEMTKAWWTYVQAPDGNSVETDYTGITSFHKKSQMAIHADVVELAKTLDFEPKNTSDATFFIKVPK